MIWIVRTGASKRRGLSAAGCYDASEEACEKREAIPIGRRSADIPAQRLARGQVGTIVEQLDEETLLVEFSDDQGRAYAVAPCPRTQLLVLHYIPEAA
jgi:hypothetical protein